MKNDNNEMMLEQEQRRVAFEESILDLAMPEVSNHDEENEPDLTRDVPDSDILLTVINEQVKAKRIWQLAVAALTIVVLIVSAFCIGLHNDRKNYIEKFNQAQLNTQKANNDFKQSSQKANTLENQLADSKTELKHTKGLLTN